MARAKCPICKKMKDTVGPKLVAKQKVHDERFVRPLDTFITKEMCKECWEKLRK